MFIIQNILLHLKMFLYFYVVFLVLIYAVIAQVFVP